MKKFLLLFLLFTIGTLHGLAQDFEFTASGINWQCTVLTDETVSICGASSPNKEAQELIFPTTVTDDAGNDYTVTDLNWKGSLNLVFSNLTKVILPKSLISISGNGVFRDCALLTTIENTENILKIPSLTFEGCSNLTEVRVPSSLQRIKEGAFNGCPSLQDVYTYTVEPTHIDQTTFSTYATATLHVPEQSFDNYYWNTEWSQFRELKAFDEPYSYFYLNNEYTLASRFKGNPLIDLNPGGENPIFPITSP